MVRPLILRGIQFLYNIPFSIQQFSSLTFFALILLRLNALTFSAIAVSDDDSFFQLALHSVQAVMH